MKQKTNSKARFDFSSDPDPNGTQIGTLRNLLDEIENEDEFSGSRQGKHAITLQTLTPTLLFVDETTGTNLDQSGLREKLPLLTLKTVKLVYRASRDEQKYDLGKKGPHLLQLLRPSGAIEKPSLEAINDYARDTRLKGIIDKIRTTLAIEIDRDRLNLIETTLRKPNRLVDEIRRLSNMHLRAMEPHRAPSPEHIIELTKRIASYDVATQPLKREESDLQSVPTHEALYIYLRCLGFIHFVGEFKKVLACARINSPINPVIDKMRQFAESSPPVRDGNRLDVDLDMNTPIVSVNELTHYIRTHQAVFRVLVKAAMGIDVRKDSLDELITRSQKLLVLSLIHNHQAELSDESIGINILDVPHISIVDCAAALCTIRHQQKLKSTKCKPHVQGERELGKGALSSLDNVSSIVEILKKDRIPHGFKLLLYRQYVEFHSAITAGRSTLEAKMAYQLARVDSYVKCMNDRDIVRIKRSIDQFESYCSYHALGIWAFPSLKLS